MKDIPQDPCLEPKQGMKDRKNEREKTLLIVKFSRAGDDLQGKLIITGSENKL